MKKLLLACAALLIAVGAFAQGSAVVFANSSTTLLTTNHNVNGTVGEGSMPANGLFKIGLYVGPQGSPAGSLTLVGSTNNSTVLAGRFSGGNPFFLPAPFNTDQTIAFQVRAWTGSAGNSYEQAVAAALLSGNTTILGGVSALGQVTTTTPPAPTPLLFGTAAGQVGGFNSAPLVPEPSSIALGLLGLGAIALFRRRK